MLPAFSLFPAVLGKPSASPRDSHFAYKTEAFRAQPILRTGSSNLRQGPLDPKGNKSSPSPPSSSGPLHYRGGRIRMLILSSARPLSNSEDKAQSQAPPHDENTAQEGQKFHDSRSLCRQVTEPALPPPSFLPLRFVAYNL